MAVASGIVLVGDRNAEDGRDVFHAIDVRTGERVWTLDHEAEGSLDYDNSPRATPLVHEGHAFPLGAFGRLHCVRLWSLAPKVAGDVNVPTPLVLGSRAVFVSENNGARSVGLDDDGQPKVEAVFARLDPDMHSPVACQPVRRFAHDTARVPRARGMFPRLGADQSSPAGRGAKQAARASGRCG